MNQINPKKLFNSKWTALQPQNREKHFMVTLVEFDEDGKVIHCVLEAIMSKRKLSIDWQILKNSKEWIQGWK